MSAIVRSLAGFCRDHPLAEKVCIVPSFITGRQLGEALARESGSWINLRFVTLAAQAQETAALELSRLGLRLIAGSERLLLVDTLFRELKAAGGLEYFGRLQPSPGVARTLLRAVECLRHEGFTGERIEPGRFAVGAKGRDIRSLLGRYERRLRDTGAVDLAGLYVLAAETARGAGAAGAPLFVCPADSVLSRIEKEFLEAVSGGRCAFIGRGPVFGLDRPRLFQPVAESSPVAPPDPASDAERLPWLFEPGQAPRPFGDGSVDIFRAVSPMCECREIVRRILDGGAVLDQVELIAPPGAGYATVLHDLALRLGLGVTFADGLPLSLTSPGRVFAGLVDWIENGYLASDLCRLVEAQDLKLPFRGPEADIPPQSVSRHLREAMIGWGRERYVERLLARHKAIEAKLRNPRGDAEGGLPDRKRADLERDLSEIARLTEAVRSFLGLIPDSPAGGPVPFEAFCSGLAGAVETCSILRDGGDGRDGQALALITEELRNMAGGSWGTPPGAALSPSALDLEASLDRLRTAVSSLSVGASAPQPGHLHVSSFHSGGVSGRPVTFILGLDDSHFPGRGLNDPVLLDAERERLSPGLPTTADSLRERLYAMAALASSLRGRVTFSYPAYDILEEREAFPSSLVLQAHRLVSGDTECNYEGLKTALTAAAESAGRPDPAGFLPGETEMAIDGTDWWLGRLAGKARPAGALNAIRRNFPGLGAGVEAEAARAKGKLTEYEGVVRIDGRRFDPLLNPDLQVSASRLESLVKCPYGYFLKYLLGVEPPEELKLDRARWLDPMDRGSLLHDILFEFMAGLGEKGERADPGRHGPVMEEIADRIIADRKLDIPPPSEGIFERERQDIRAALEVFLRVEGGRPPHIVPFAFEKGFSGVPIEVEGGRSFRLKGRIDRIDRTGPGTYRIIDYKSGNPGPFEGLQFFGRGRMIQHALYAVAAEHLLVEEGLADRARVTESGYFFPTRRGEGREILVPEFDRKAFRALLRDILALITNGYFVRTPKDDCRFCDFSALCGGRHKETQEKLEADPKIGPAFERLKSYE
jgi:ATP-dependent helicase/nuclease subunit B